MTAPAIPLVPAMRARRGALAVTGQADAERISQRPAQLAVLRKLPIQRSDADVDVLMSLCEGIRWLQNEVRRDDDRRALVRTLRYTYLGPRHVVVREGARGNEMFLVLSGRLQAKTISRRQVDGTDEDAETEIVLAELGPNDHFGELALINPLGTRAATVVTVEPTELLRVDRSDFQQVTRVGAKASRMQAVGAASTGTGEVWHERLRALQVAAFDGDALALQRALMPEVEAAVIAVRDRRRMEGFHRKLRAKREEQAQLASRHKAFVGGVNALVDEVARVAQLQEKCRKAIARVEHAMHVQGATLTDSQRHHMRKTAEETRVWLLTLKQSQRDNQAELAHARKIADSAKRAVSTADAERMTLERKIEECRAAVLQANAVERLIDIRDTEGRTAAFLAAEAGHHGLLVLLQRHGAELHIPDHQGVSPLHIACRRGHAKVVRYLLSLDVRRLQEVEDNNAETPFYTACFEGNIEIVKMIIESLSCDVNKATSAGTTPIFACVEHGNLECVKLIAECAAHRGTRVDYTRARNADGATPFYIACRHGDVSCVKYLSEHAPVSTRETPADDGTTPIAIAACQGHLAVVRFLGEIGANPETQNRAGNAPLHLAAAEGHVDVVQYLVDDLHAPLFVSNASGVDPFQAAADASNAGAVEVVRWLAARPIPPAEAMKRTRLLQRRLRKPNDVTNPLRQPASAAEEKADMEDEETWVAEEEARTARLAKKQLVSNALQESGGVWSMLSSTVATDGHTLDGLPSSRTASSSALDILALMDQAKITGTSMEGPTDDEIAAELRAIEWNNIANGTTVSEGGITTAVRGKQLSVNSVYRRLLKARPEWGKGAVPDLKERVRGLHESARAAAGKRWLRYLATEACDPKEPWAWNAPSLVFGEMLTASAGMAVPGPETKLAKIERPAAAVSDWTEGTAPGPQEERAAASSENQRPQGHDAIARSAMAAAEAHWALMHPEEAEKKQERHGPSAATADSVSRSGISSDVAAPREQVGTTDGGAPPWGRLRGRRGAVLAADFAQAWTGGDAQTQVESVSKKPETVGERAGSTAADTSGAGVRSGSVGVGNDRYESRAAFLNRVHRERVAAGDQTMGWGVASAAVKGERHREEAWRANQPGAVAARRRASILDVARQRKKMARQ